MSHPIKGPCFDTAGGAPKTQMLLEIAADLDDSGASFICLARLTKIVLTHVFAELHVSEIGARVTVAGVGRKRINQLAGCFPHTTIDSWHSVADSHRTYSSQFSERWSALSSGQASSYFSIDAVGPDLNRRRALTPFRLRVLLGESSVESAYLPRKLIIHEARTGQIIRLACY